MATTFHNSGLRSNVIRDARPPIPSDLHGDVIEIQFPTRAIKAVDLAHMPASIIDNYAANTKTMVQNMFNARNLNENLNFKNTFYLAERDEMANKEANTIFGHEKVYPKQVVDADLKAQYTGKSWKDAHVKSEKKVKDALRQTTDNVSKIREEEANVKADEQAKHEKEVKKHFKKVQNLIGTITGSPKITHEKIRKTSEDETERIGVQNIERDAHDEEKILNNRANIRTLLGARSQENQDKLQAEREAKEQLIAEEEAERLRIQRSEEKRVEKFMSLEKLSKSWRITDKTKLKEVVRNEIMKEIMKEEERKNFEKIAEFMKKKPDTLIKKVNKPKAKPKMEPPKAYSPSSKRGQSQKKKKDEKKYVFSPEKIHKLPAESAAEYRARFNFTVMALPQQKATLDPVEQHEITKKFQEMIVKKGVEKNGQIVFESKKTF